MKPNQIEFYIGGCRSGKSRAALVRAEALDVDRRLFVATCRPEDDEMRARVERHQAERGDQWETVEEPLDMAGLVHRHSDPRTAILVDCLTLWLTNMILEDAGDAAVEGRVAALTRCLSAARGPVLLVANEVGLGIVPENALSRRFRDWAGTVNQTVAACADAVFLCVAGLTVPVKTSTPEDPRRNP